MLHHFKNFKRYRPTKESRPDYADLIDAGVGFEMDEEGRDWYDLRELFQKDTFKVVYMEDGTVLQCEKDTNELCPHGMAGVVELESVPDGLRRHTNFMYKFNGTEVVLNEEYFKRVKDCYIQQAGRKIEMYRDLVELGVDVGDKLEAWRKYRVAVFNVDTSLMGVIEWPKAPEE